MKKEYAIAIEAAIEAGKAILDIYNSASDIEIVSKDDNSPLTKADKASNDVINSYLTNTPFPIISEENKQASYEERKTWETCWIVDPLDGTKEFIKKNGEFTVNIALCQQGRPIFGVIYVPVSRELFYGEVENHKAFKTILNSEHVFDQLFDSKDSINPKRPQDGSIRIVGSRSHMNEDTENFIQSVKSDFDNISIVSKGSSLKFCLVAEGLADIYPRFAPTMEWDTAAGQAICNSVGLDVIAEDTKKPLLYNKENLLNPYFLISN